jgi:DNA-3-methyladenine glycosylase II
MGERSTQYKTGWLIVGLSAEQLAGAMGALAGIEPAFARALDRAGAPSPRISTRGYATLLRTIVGQQVSVASAQAVFGRLETMLGDVSDPALLVGASEERLRACGLSRQKMGYARSLAGLVASGELDLLALPQDDEAAIAELVRIKGIGRWSAEIYLLFAEGRPDIWPAGDLAVQIEVGRIMGLPDRPDEATTRAIADGWRPHRGAAAIFAWHHYAWSTARKSDAVPL